jgi:hypothetical protein
MDGGGRERNRSMTRVIFKSPIGCIVMVAAIVIGIVLTLLTGGIPSQDTWYLHYNCNGIAACGQALGGDSGTIPGPYQSQADCDAQRVQEINYSQGATGVFYSCYQSQ